MSGKGAKIKALLRNGYHLTVAAPGSGKLVIDWYARVKHKQVLVASASVTFRKAGRFAVKIALTKAGHKLLAAGHHVTLTAQATFSAPG